MLRGMTMEIAMATNKRLDDARTIVGARRRLSAERGAELLDHLDALTAELANVTNMLEAEREGFRLGLEKEVER